MKNWKEAKANWQWNTNERGVLYRLPVRNYYVDITTGEQLEYWKIVYDQYQTKYTQLKTITKIYDNVIDKRIERTIEYTPRDPD